MPTAQIERIVDTDRRRVKSWTRIAVALWVFAALGAVFIFLLGAVTFPAIAQSIMEENAAKTSEASTENSKNTDKELGTLEKPNTAFLMLAKLTAMCMVVGSGSFLILVLAGLATVLLLARSRAATLRQINANLLQISEQLKRPAPGTAIGNT
jgi:hypothetical protein